MQLAVCHNHKLARVQMPISPSTAHDGPMLPAPLSPPTDEEEVVLTVEAGANATPMSPDCLYESTTELPFAATLYRSNDMVCPKSAVAVPV
jgi:hypothetical protein